MVTAAPLAALRLCGTPALGPTGGSLRTITLQRGAALLACLAWTRGPLPRGWLAAQLWPEAREAVARARLRRLAYTLESSSGAALFELGAEHIGLRHDRVRVDTLEFAEVARAAVAGVIEADAIERLEAYAAHAAQPLLAGVDIGSEPFDDWRRQQRIEQEHLLARLLVRLAETHLARSDPAAAQRCAERLVALDPYDEPAHVLLMRAHAAAGNAAGIDAVYLRCAEALRAEFGTRPGAATEAAYVELVDCLRVQATPAQLAAPAPAVRFAESPQGAIAYATLGDAAEAIVVIAGFVSHIEIAWEDPRLREFLTRLTQRYRVLVFDRRGLGLSERLGATGTIEAAAGDVHAILDHAGVERAWLFGASEGGPIALRLAADHPERVRGVMLFGALAKGTASPDHPWALGRDAFDVWLERLVAGWGGPSGLETFAPSARDDRAVRAWWARMLRHAASPATLRLVLHGLREVDIRPLLPCLRVPALVMHRRGDRAVRFGAGEYLAQRLPGAHWLPLDGDDHWWWRGDTAPVLRAMLDFGARA